MAIETGETPSFRVDSAADQVFREDVRSWIAANLPDNMRNHVHRPPDQDMRAWHKKVHERGWIAPHWPSAFGGMGATIDEQIILQEEMLRAKAPPLVSAALNFVGPCLIENGSPEQQAEHLPKILSGEVVWAQGYSEPGAGSDLASLTTRAVRDADSYVVNGHKIWTSGAEHGEWIFTLVRTDTDAPKHKGISVLLIDLSSPGITVRPIEALAMNKEFCEVFFDDVRVPAANLVGDENNGWRVANSLLVHERMTGGNPQDCLTALDRLKLLANETGAADDPSFRERLAELEIDVLSLCAAFSHMVGLSKEGVALGPETSVWKIFKTRTLQALTDALVDATGSYAPGWTAHATLGAPVAATDLYLQSRRATIFGGAYEVQHNIVAKRVLNLP